MSPLHFATGRLLFMWQLLWPLTQAAPIPEWTRNPVKLTSESWMPTKLWSWHPSDKPLKSPYTRKSRTEAGDIDYVGSSTSSETLVLLKKLTDSSFPYQDTSTPEQPTEPDEFTVSPQDLHKLTVPRKQPENILMLNGGQTWVPVLPSQFKTAGVDQTTDYQLSEILAPLLRSHSSKTTKFIVSPHDLKDLAQHRELAKVVVGKSQLQNQILEDDYEDSSMNEAYSDGLPLRSQENTGEPSEHPEQFEPSQFKSETETRDPVNHQNEAPDYPPQPPEASMYPEINGTFQNKNEAEHSNWPNVTVKPADLEITVNSEVDKKAESISSQQQQAPAQLPKNAEEVGPSLNPPEALHLTSEIPEDLETSGSQLEVPALPTKLPEEVSTPAEQEVSVSAPDTSMQSTVENTTAVQNPNQDQVYHYTLPTITVHPTEVELTTSSEFSPGQQQQPAEPSESPGQVESSKSDLESLVHLQDYAEEVEFSTSQQDVIPSQHPGPLLEDEPFSEIHSVRFAV